MRERERDRLLERVPRVNEFQEEKIDLWDSAFCFPMKRIPRRSCRRVSRMAGTWVVSSVLAALLLLLGLRANAAQSATTAYVASSKLQHRADFSSRPNRSDGPRAIRGEGGYGCRLRFHAKVSRPGDSDETTNDALDKGMNLLELASSRGGFFLPTQPLVVRTAKATWRFVWERMMSELAPHDSQGNYVRPGYTYASTTSPGVREASQQEQDGSATGHYQLYVGNPCPWCHRAVLAVRILGLDPGEERGVGITRLMDDPEKATRGGWVFSSKDPDPVYRCADLRELYDRLSAGGSYTGRCTAPLLVDKKAKSIVSNESADIVRFLNRLSQRRADSSTATPAIDLYPPELAAEIDAVNDWVYELLNNGVYRCGFATSQAAYDRASKDVRLGLGRCDSTLSQRPFLAGDRFTEADLRLLPTILRFDGAYGPLFRAGGAHVRIQSYPNLHRWLVRCWEDVPGVQGSIDLPDACSSYFRQLFPLNPGGIVPSPVTLQDLGLVVTNPT
jgi:glutathionyl-hydroquinone reductase